MSYKTIHEKVDKAGAIIYGHLNGEGRIKKLQEDYLRGIWTDFTEDAGDYEDFRKYFEYNIDDYIDYVFSAYMERLIPLVTEVTEEELNTLTINERDSLLAQFVDYFKAKSKLSERCWGSENIVIIKRRAM